MQYTVAIADDEEMMLNGLTRLIPWEEMGYRVATAVESGRGLIEFLEDNAVDVVLSDIRMNDMDGMDVARYIHANCPNTVIVLISGYSEFSYARQSIEFGVYKYMLKPVSVDEMRALMADVRGEIEKRRSASRMAEQYNEMRLSLRERFMIEAAAGELRDERKLKKRARQAGISPANMRYGCMVVSIISLKGNATYGTELIRGNIMRLNPGVSVFVLYEEADWLRVLLVEKTPGILPAAERADEFAQEIAHSLYHSAGLDMGVYVYTEKSYKSLSEFCRYGFAAWNLPVIEDEQKAPGVYNNLSLRNDIIKAMRENRLDDMRKNLLEYMTVCAAPTRGLWHSRFMARIILWDIARAIDESEQLVHLPDEEKLIRASSPEMITEQVMCDYQKMLEFHAQEQKRQDTIECAKRYIEAHYAEDISLLALAKLQLYMSPAYFSRLFHEKTGSTYVDYLNSVRLDAAAKLLCSADMSVANVAEKVGYRDQKYFTRRFKTRFGCTPSEYKKNQGTDRN